MKIVINHVYNLCNNVFYIKTIWSTSYMTVLSQREICWAIYDSCSLKLSEINFHLE